MSHNPFTNHRAKPSILKTIWWAALLSAITLILLTVAGSSQVSASTVDTQVYQISPTTDILSPQALERLSWGAVIAGSVISLIMMLALNLLGISLGVTSINPSYDEDSASAQSLATGAAVWVGFSTLVALFAGGWLAARFAGIPNNLDGLLHGLLVWGVVMLITMLLVFSGIGRIISGMSTLVNQGLHLAGQTAQVAARGAAGVAHVTADVAQAAARGAANAAQGVAESVSDAMPSAAQTQMSVDRAVENIRNEAQQLLRQAGIEPERVESEVQNAGQDVQQAVRAAARNPEHADDILFATLNRLLMRTRQVTNGVDRDEVVNMLVQRTPMTEQEARQTIQRWEATVERARQEGQRVVRDAQQHPEETMQEVQHQVEDIRHQVEGTVDDARMRAEQAVEDVRRQVNETRHDVEQRVEQVRHDIEHGVRETAQSVTDAIAKVAAALFAAILVGAIAAGLGGFIGAPEEVPVIAEVRPDFVPVEPVTVTPDLITPQAATPQG